MHFRVMAPPGAPSVGRRPSARTTGVNRRSCFGAEGGFTMVEIAIALGVIGFALVAIIGILPAGLEVQRDNRSETIINQDGTFWLEAIRNGALGLDNLSNNVEEIRTPEGDFILGSRGLVPGNPGEFTYGSNIIGLLTSALDKGTNRIEAVITAISGSASEKETDKGQRDLSFKYLLGVRIESSTNSTLSFAQITSQIFEPLETSYEVRLTLSYPYIETRTNQPPSRRQTYRAVVSRSVITNVINGITNCYFVP